MAIKVGVETIPPLTLAAVRVILAAVILYGATLLRGERLAGGLRFWTFCFLLGVIGNGLPFTLIGWGEQRISSGLAAILMSVMPLATVVMAHFFTTGDRVTPAKFAGVVIGFGGIVVLVGPEALKGLGSDLWRQLAVGGGALCYAVAVILARNTPPAPLIGDTGPPPPPRLIVGSALAMSMCVVVEVASPSSSVTVTVTS